MIAKKPLSATVVAAHNGLGRGATCAHCVGHDVDFYFKNRLESPILQLFQFTHIIVAIKNALANDGHGFNGGLGCVGVIQEGNCTAGGLVF